MRTPAARAAWDVPRAAACAQTVVRSAVRAQAVRAQAVRERFLRLVFDRSSICSSRSAPGTPRSN